MRSVIYLYQAYLHRFEIDEIYIELVMADHLRIDSEGCTKSIKITGIKLQTLVKSTRDKADKDNKQTIMNFLEVNHLVQPINYIQAIVSIRSYFYKLFKLTNSLNQSRNSID